MFIYNDFDHRTLKSGEIIPMLDVYNHHHLNRRFTSSLQDKIRGDCDVEPEVHHYSYQRGIAHGFLYAAALLLSIVLLWITKI